MKNLITSIASIVILLLFVMQFATNQLTYNKISDVDKALNNFKEVAKQEGCISPENKRLLKDNLTKTLDCEESDILVTGTETKIDRGGKIYYSLTVPIENVVAGYSVWGLSEKDVIGTYKSENYTTSEFIIR